ncbi:enoyl-CoA hydratase/isomerase family protein [Streptomyces sp. NPDC058657]|uniref:enoyl-CoA hydratase/isomerase family protein n=1 Tax=unclassified Streptomyces TaxID=2593676 RepID=UPI003657139A
MTRVRLDVSDHIATVQLDRPPHNVFDSRAQEELYDTAHHLARRADVRAVVIRGHRSFSSGADIEELRGMDHTRMLLHVRAQQEAFTAVAEIPQPVLAALSGYALGAGCELALCADARIASRTALLGLPEIHLGIIPGGGGTQRLARLIGPARAKGMICTGRTLRADEALRVGLVDEVVPTGDLDSRALVWAREMAAGPQLALRAAKEVIDRGVETDLSTGLALERAAFSNLFATEDRATGLASHLENGPRQARFHPVRPTAPRPS